MEENVSANRLDEGDEEIDVGVDGVLVSEGILECPGLRSGDDDLFRYGCDPETAATAATSNGGDSLRSMLLRLSGWSLRIDCRIGEVGNTSSTGAFRARDVGRDGAFPVLILPPPYALRPARGGASVEAWLRDRKWADENVLVNVERGEVLRGRY